MLACDLKPGHLIKNGWKVTSVEQVSGFWITPPGERHYRIFLIEMEKQAVAESVERESQPIGRLEKRRDWFYETEELHAR